MPAKAATTKKTTRKRTPKAVEPVAVEPEPVPEPGAPEPTPEPQPEAEQPPGGNIGRVYVGTHAGVEVCEKEQAWPLIREIRARADELFEGDDTPFICYEDGQPVYVALRASALRPMAFPDPGKAAEEYGVTSVELYGWAVTLAQTIAKIVEKETQGKPSLLSDAKKIMTLALPIVAAIFAIFIMAVLLGG